MCMNYPSLRFARIAVAAAALAACICVIAATPDPALTAAIADPARSANFVARDKTRHPAEELTFFGIAPKMTVVELWPGGGYWTEILGPYLAPGGHYTVALPPTGGEGDSGVARFRKHIEAEKSRLGTIHETILGTGHFDIAPPGFADLILTF